MVDVTTSLLLHNLPSPINSLLQFWWIQSLRQFLGKCVASRLECLRCFEDLLESYVVTLSARLPPDPIWFYRVSILNREGSCVIRDKKNGINDNILRDKRSIKLIKSFLSYSAHFISHQLNIKTDQCNANDTVVAIKVFYHFYFIDKETSESSF